MNDLNVSENLQNRRLVYLSDRAANLEALQVDEALQNLRDDLGLSIGEVLRGQAKHIQIRAVR